MLNRKPNVHHDSVSLNLAKSLLNEAVFRPMLFSTPMVKALLNGTKTQTRKPVKHKDFDVLQFEHIYKEWFCKFYATTHEGSDLHVSVDIFPQVLEKQFIWVRETFIPYHSGYFEYKSTISEEKKLINQDFKIKWKPSIFMPKAACQIWNKVKSVRCELLTDITEDDAIKEGILKINLTENSYLFYDYLSNRYVFNSAVESYKSLWISINGSKSWFKRYVWVYEFEVSKERPHGFI